MSDATRPTLAQTVYPAGVLAAICVVAGLLLGVVHGLTAPIAQANAEQRAQETYAALVPEAASFEPLACEVEGCTAALAALDAQGQVVAYVMVAQAKGYGGQVPLAVAFDPDGTVRAVVALSNSETPGLGTRIAEGGYLDQYVGLSAQAAEADVDLISGATISSRAALAAFNAAAEAYGEVS